MIAEIDMFAWVILPALIFFARVCDVTIGTARLIFVAQGYRRLAPIVGFFEVLIWILAIGQIMKHLSNPICYVAYAGGFATGNYVGMLWVERLSIGQVMIRIITQRDATRLIQHLRAQDFGCTVLDGQGREGPVKIVFTIVPKSHMAEVIQAVERFNPKAFYTVEEVKNFSSGIVPPKSGSLLGPRSWPLRPFRKGK